MRSRARTAVGPLINEAAAEPVEAWARVLTGGKRRRYTYQPTVLADVSDSVTIAQEVFGRSSTNDFFDDIEEAFDRVNASRYGLQTGVFTPDLRAAFAAHRRLQVGGVVVGDVLSHRARSDAVRRQEGLPGPDGKAWPPRRRTPPASGCSS
jgi:acyl-CoA reductase-like NAD-dependent aldehyde dehydrogenase